MENTQERRAPNDEIDLGELLLAIWDGKWLIGSVVVACLLLAIAYLYWAPKTYSTQLELRPITSFDAEPYDFLNRLGFFEIERDELLSLFGERLATRVDIREAAIKHKLVDRAQFSNDEEYLEEVREFTNSITMEGPGISANENERITIILKPEGPSPQAAAASFNEVLDQVNQFVRNTLENRFYTRIDTESRLRNLKLEDITRQIESTREDYDLRITQRIAFLAEQADIARQLNLPKPVTEAQTVVTSGSMNVGIIQEQPYYLFGYEAIEKEMALIESREDKNAFITELTSLEKQRRDLINDPRLERAKVAFEATPIMSSEEFKAANWSLSSRDFESETRPALVLALSLVLGGMLGLFMLFVRNAIVNTRKRSV